jgi:hypothetical protein
MTECRWSSCAIFITTEPRYILISYENNIRSDSKYLLFQVSFLNRSQIPLFRLLVAECKAVWYVSVVQVADVWSPIVWEDFGSYVSILDDCIIFFVSFLLSFSFSLASFFPLNYNSTCPVFLSLLTTGFRAAMYWERSLWVLQCDSYVLLLIYSRPDH